jgi:hypothetical protein
MKFESNIFLFFFILILLTPCESKAQIFKIKVTDYGGIDAFPVLKNILDNKIIDFQNQVNSALPSEGPNRIMKGMANTSAIAGKGIGSDYSSYMTKYTIAFSGRVGLDLEHDKSTDSDISGVGAATGFTVGTKAKNMNIQEFAGLDTDRLSLYGNFMYLGQEFELLNNGGVEADLRVGLLNIGTHLRYDWIEGIGDAWLGWGGVKLHWGLEFNRSKLVFQNKIDHVFSAGTSQDNISGRITGNPKYEIVATTYSIPLEISSDVRFLQIFTIYGGVGADINYGKATGRGQLDGDVSPLVCTGSGVCSGGRLVKVQVQANLDAEGRVSPFYLRGFTGLQINLPHVQIYGQVDKAYGTEIIALTAGIRYVY